jgi:serine phosphatase RsbU (regulator of sigma subunit)
VIFSALNKALKYFLLVFTFSFILNNIEGENIDSLLLYEETIPNDTNKIIVLNKIANFYLENEQLESIHYAKKAYQLSQKLEYKNGIISSMNILVNANDYLGRYSETQKLNYQFLEIYQHDSNLSGISSTNNNIGIIHYYLGNYNLALEFTNKALEQYQQQNDSSGISICYNNLANVYSDKEDYKTSLSFYFKALTIDENANDDGGISLIKGNIGEVYTELEDYDNAYKFLIEALFLAEKTKDKYQQSNMLCALGDLLYRQNKPDEALDFLKKGLAINNELNLRSESGEIYETISAVFQQKGDYVQALHYLQLTKEVNDEIYSKENTEKIAEMNAYYETKEKENELQKQAAISAMQKSQKTFLIIGSLIGFALLFIIVGISVKGNITKRKTNQTLENQKLQIETKNRDITDSIQYAKRIQGAILPSDKMIKKHLKESFIFYKPKDIVAGDFYWMDTDGENVLFAAADCTGHGVPGAMVSVVCHNALNRAVREFKLTEPAKILDKVTHLVIETFEQSEANIKDGMDIALCNFNTKTNELQYAGANNSLYLIRDNELIEIKSDKQPIGKYNKIFPFTNHKLTIKEKDCFYLFTDGYADQFGGEKGKKFKYKQFKELLLKNHKDSMQEQLNSLTNTFNNWKGNLEQIDDVCVIGVRI